MKSFTAMTSRGYRIASTALLLAIVVAIGALISASYYAISLLGEEGTGLAVAGAAGAILAAAWAAFAWTDTEGGN